MAQKKRKFVDSDVFRRTASIVGVAVLSIGAAVATFRVSHPIAISYVESLCMAPKSLEAKNFAVLAAIGWALFFGVLMAFAYVGVWVIYAATQRTDGLTQKVAIGIGCHAFHRLLVRIQTAMQTFIAMCQDEVEYKNHEAQRQKVVESLKIFLSNFRSSLKRRRTAFDAIMDDARGMELGIGANELEQRICMDLLGEAERPCDGAEEWRERKQRLAATARSFLKRAADLARQFRTLDPSRMLRQEVETEPNGDLVETGSDPR